MSEVQRVSVNGRELECQHCGHRTFLHKTATLDRMAPGGLVHFAPKRAAPRPRASSSDDCLACGKPIPVDATACPACGWTWQGESAET